MKYRGYAYEVFSEEHLELFHKADELVKKAFWKDSQNRLVRCHELARAVGRVLRLKWVDGKYATCEHSWLKLNERTIIDVYTPARLPVVQLIDLHGLFPEKDSYKEADELRKDIRWGVVEKLEDIFTDQEPWKSRKNSIAIDFDGVMHGGHWAGMAEVTAGPQPGVLKTVLDYIDNELDVVVLTCRALSLEGKKTVQEWLKKHGFPELEVTATKPHSLLYIDDRSFVYDGKKLPTAREARNFRPWNKR